MQEGDDGKIFGHTACVNENMFKRRNRVDWKR